MTVEQSKIDEVAGRFLLISPFLNERQRRLWAGAEAVAIGHGGVKAVARACGLSVLTVTRGCNDLAQPLENVEPPETGSIRRPGAGRPRVEDSNPEILEALLKLVEPTARGDPQGPLRWTCKSTTHLADEMKRQGYKIGTTTVGRLLKEQDFSLQSLRKSHEGDSHPDRDAQFNNINKMVRRFQKRKQPVISVDAKKKELIGDFPNTGQEWHKKRSPQKVNAYTFSSLADGRASPYGILDIMANEGWVSVGISADTAEFAVNSINSWWERLGKNRYPGAKELLITADCGGSNGYRTRLWKKELQGFSDRTNLRVRVMHYPPGTSKWNKIEHRMFNHITVNWRGRPLTSFEVVVNCIASTSTKTGLSIGAELDENAYEKGRKVSKQEMEACFKSG